MTWLGVHAFSFSEKQLWSHADVGAMSKYRVPMMAVKLMTELKKLKVWDWGGGRRWVFKEIKEHLSHNPKKQIVVKNFCVKHTFRYTKFSEELTFLTWSARFVGSASW